MISSNNRAVAVRLLMVVLAAHLLVACQAEEEEPEKQNINAISPWSGGNGRKYGDETMNWRDYTFMIFRYALFVFIICFPFIRGTRVWYRAGGRILWRRNERGWITGIRFQPPDLERWLLLSGYTPEGSDAVNPRIDGPRKLTADEVYELPEITYSKPDEVDEHDIERGASPNDELAATHHGNDAQTSNSNNSKPQDDKIESNDAKASEMDETDIESAPVSVATPSSGEDPTTESSSIEMVSQKPSAAATRAISQLYTTTTISTSCSICIEDFCEGEKVRLLPCGHAFHTECILPWLTERQGCCPCCKKPVIEETPENEDKDNEDGENNPQNSNTDNNNNNENASAAGRSSYMVVSRHYHSRFVGPW